MRDVVFLHNELFFAAAQKKYICSISFLFCFSFLGLGQILSSYALKILVVLFI